MPSISQHNYNHSNGIFRYPRRCCSSTTYTALKVVNANQVKDVPTIKGGVESSKFMVIGHRGCGMNMLRSSSDRKIKENTILSFNAAAKFGVHFVEFDVQVTKDDCPVIFHDNFILTEENGTIYERRVIALALAEFLSCGPQKESGNVGLSLLRKTKDGRVFNWNVEEDGSLCTLQEAFQKVDSTLGFNIELKFDDYILYKKEELLRALEVILQVAFEYAKERPLSFRRLQKIYPVFFLTNGGSEVYTDARRNSLDEALKLCLANDLQGIVSDVKVIFRNPGALLILYFSNVPEAVYVQHFMGINGVIVDLVREITESVSNLTKEEGKMKTPTIPNFSQREMSFLLKLIPQLIQH
ncbi:hypothetical protein GIB67_009447 [Kingdonia uniflora]|uniref:glycerophosphodiester phosphodiesterase n=1 Tax=Kingdonia uniflora TaxID=39325 RepID=A0A7J7N3T4_9MAGN|nr:hypothetical protein GIB67_009447 [Kingdonia uniflora]